MNPIYTGKDVSFIDTKQANRAAETTVLDAEKFAVFAGLLAGADYPQAALAKAWVQLAYGAHHDAITGSESDQVYLDLLTGWRDAWELGRAVRDNSLALLSQAVSGDVVVWNSLAHKRTNVVTVRLDTPGRVFDADGDEMPAVVEPDGHSVTFLARDVPSLGWRAYRVLPCEVLSGWKPLSGNVIANEHYRLSVDPARGGGVSSWVHDGRELIAEAGSATSLPSTRNTRRTRARVKARGTCCPKARCVLFVGSVRGARLSRPARAAAGHPRPHRPVAALHADADPVARHRAGGLPDQDRRVHRHRPVAAAALAVPGGGRHAGQRGRRRRRGPRLRAAARRRPGGGHRTISLDAGQPGLRLVRAVLGGAGAGGTRCGRCRWPRWCRRRRRRRVRWHAR
ncbi:alpha mannosidase, middle domain protein [Mycobacterium xenopi 4042]|uniref:Alpha mannosidase, middle domain protein n=1 Tax=Mycobacterium xenopi 4042 TaxID=1299334 RepID=X7YKS1_MYCXE|nr:alpha mannosidase, middle domain protein [Mycobacterium xenopi 4042]